jgi:hypothetical protein
MTAEPSPEIHEQPGVEATFVHFDDLRPQRVRTQRHPDGSERSVWDRWFVVSQDPPFVSLHTTWDPDVVVHRHGHLGHHLVYVLTGGMWAGDRWCPPGTYIDLPLGAAAGPYVAGPDGVDLFEVTLGDGRSWTPGTDDFAQLLAERGITPLPNPPIELPDWMEDRRSDQTALGSPPEPRDG